MARKERKSVDNIFRYICRNALVCNDDKDAYSLLNEKISVRRNFGEFFKMVYNSVVGSDLHIDVPLHKLSDEQYEDIRDEILQLVCEVSVSNFSDFVKHKGNCFSLYNIDAQDSYTRELQIDFYCDFVWIMRDIYIGISGKSTKEIDNKCDRTRDIFRLLREENHSWNDGKDEPESIKHKDNDNLERLIKKFTNIEDKGVTISETKNLHELYFELLDLTMQILAHKDLSDLQRQFYTEKKEYYTKQRIKLVFKKGKSR